MYVHLYSIKIEKLFQVVFARLVRIFSKIHMNGFIIFTYLEEKLEVKLLPGHN